MKKILIFPSEKEKYPNITATYYHNFIRTKNSAGKSAGKFKLLIYTLVGFLS